MKRTKEECLESLREAKEILGETPSKSQYEELGLAPAHSTILRKFDSWNVAKKEAGLDILDKGDRVNNDIKSKPDDLELPEDETWEELNPQQRSYRKNKDKWYEKEKKRREERVEWVREYKIENCECYRCEEEHPATLDFHHIGDKDMGIAEMANNRYSIKRIKEEMENCIVLCANCHRKEHYEGPVQE